jgi:hypothetical protein
LPATLRIPATLTAARAAQDEAQCGLALTFAPLLARHGQDALHDYLDLAAPLSLESARGLAQLTRLLRATRLAARGPVERWLGAALAGRLHSAC